MLQFTTTKRKVVGTSPWERDAKGELCSPDDDVEQIMKCTIKRPRFHKYSENMHLDVYTKRAALKAAPSVVSLVSYSGEEEIFQGSGTIVESDAINGIILTSASLIRCPTGKNSIADSIKVVVHLSDRKLLEGQILAHDFHYNIAAIKIEYAPLLTATLMHLDDSLSVDPKELHIPEDKSFQLRQHSNSYNIIPGDLVIALGRYFIKPHDLMAAPGEFSLNCCENECKELFRASCNITRCGVGGPLINRHGEVIGICFYEYSFTPFLPINIASLWWEHHKKYGEPRRPWLGMEVTNLYAADLDILEKIIKNFPSVFKGAVVEEVIPGSSADSAGIRCNDVIVNFGGKSIQSFLELFENMWNKVGDSVELVVIRASADVPLHLSMVVDEVTSDKSYCWPLWEPSGL